MMISLVVWAGQSVLTPEPRAQEMYDHRAEIRSAISVLLATTKTAAWHQESWEMLGEEEQWTSAQCWWSAPDTIRLDVHDGRGKGATAILLGNRVYGFRRGLLSFITRDFELRHPKVLSLRRNDMSENGFLDDLEYAILIWDRVFISSGSQGEIILRFRDGKGLTSRLYVRRDPLRVAVHERIDGDTIVERYRYRDVVYNIAIDEKLFRP